MSAPTLPEIAASMAKALELERHGDWYWIPGKVSADASLGVDGDKLFDPFWRARCQDWLLERGRMNFSFFGKDRNEFVGMMHQVCIYCPAAEFCARAIHHLMTEGEG